MIRSGLLLLVLVCAIGRAVASKDVVFVESMFVSDYAAMIISDSISPGQSVELFTSKDKIIYYFANIGVINPAKKKYDVEIKCMNSKGDTVIKGKLKRSLPNFNGHQGESIIRSVAQTLGLDPKPGAMVEGQLIPLESGNDYFIELSFDNKLVGITRFHYTSEK